MIFASAIAAAFLVIIHLFSYRLKFLNKIPRSSWLSAAGGASVAYVFIHLLPELQEWQNIFEEESKALDFLSHHLYLLSLLGLCVYYGIERAALLSNESNRETKEDVEITSGTIFYIHITSFAVYNALIGYLLINRDQAGYLELVLFAIAMGFHFMVNDFGLYDHYRRRYLNRGRWLTSFSIMIGWLVGLIVEVSVVGIAIIFAFISGGVILNVLKEELPEKRKSRFVPFLSGALIYALLLILI